MCEQSLEAEVVRLGQDGRAQDLVVLGQLAAEDGCSAHQPQQRAKECRVTVEEELRNVSRRLVFPRRLAGTRAQASVTAWWVGLVETRR